MGREAFSWSCTTLSGENATMIKGWNYFAPLLQTMTKNGRRTVERGPGLRGEPTTDGRGTRNIGNEMRHEKRSFHLILAEAPAIYCCPAARTIEIVHMTEFAGIQMKMRTVYSNLKDKN